MKFVIGAIAIAVGIFFVIKTEWFVENFGSSSWAEEHLGSSGGSRLMYKLIGLALIFGSIMAMTGLLQVILLNIFAPLFGAK